MGDFELNFLLIDVVIIFIKSIVLVFNEVILMNFN